MDNGRTIWSDYLEKKYDVDVNNQASASFYDYDSSLAYSEGKANVKLLIIKQMIFYGQIPLI